MSYAAQLAAAGERRYERKFSLLEAASSEFRAGLERLVLEHDRRYYPDSSGDVFELVLGPEAVKNYRAILKRERFAFRDLHAILDIERSALRTAEPSDYLAEGLPPAESLMRAIFEMNLESDRFKKR